jgi:predicted flap endonuclease-1-like 5' DNA nuclease
MAARDQLNWEENLVSFVGGGGLILAMVGGALVGFGSDTDLARLLAFIGIALVILSIALWLVLLQPWKKFDDLQTPYYTGHHHDHDAEHAEHTEKHDAPSVAELAVEDELPPRVEAPVAVQEPVAEAPKAEKPKAAPKAEPAKVEEPKPAPKAESAKAEKPPALVKETASAEPDDLTLIEGIGPKVAEALNASGITTLAQLATLTPDKVEHIIKVEQKVRIVGSPATWVRQAKLAAVGDVTALDDLKKRIKSGYLYDDLTEIEGIGPKAQDALYEVRIRSFDDLAVAGLDDLKKALKKAKLDMDPETWPKQAQFIIDDDLTGLKKYQATLNK